MSVTTRFAPLLALVTCGSVAAVAPSGGARHRQATGLNTAGLRLMKTGQTARAVQRFRDAIAVEPGYALAHYNLACASSLLRDVPTAIAELEWLSERDDDPVARARLDKALTDPDLDFVSALPAVRELLKVPKFSSEHTLAWLAERSGVWSAELPRSDCAARSYTFQFASDGLLQLTIREACAGEAPRVNTWEGRLTPTDDGKLDVTVDDWPQWPKLVKLALQACPGLEDAPASCFVLASEKADIGPFHRGTAGTSPLQRSKDLAAK